VRNQFTETRTCVFPDFANLSEMIFHGVEISQFRMKKQTFLHLWQPTIRMQLKASTQECIGRQKERKK
jgi:hypothetical protein